MVIKKGFANIINQACLIKKEASLILLFCRDFFMRGCVLSYDCVLQHSAIYPKSLIKCPLSHNRED